MSTTPERIWKLVPVPISLENESTSAAVVNHIIEDICLSDDLIIKSQERLEQGYLDALDFLSIEVPLALV